VHANCSSQNRLLQVSQGELLQARVVVSAELERFAEDVDELDRTSLPLLLVEPFLMEADRDSHAVRTFAIGIDEARFARTECNLLICDASYKSICAFLLVTVVIEAPGE
jgi:hypothetical protein